MDFEEYLPQPLVVCPLSNISCIITYHLNHYQFSINVEFNKETVECKWSNTTQDIYPLMTFVPTWSNFAGPVM